MKNVIVMFLLFLVLMNKMTISMSISYQRVKGPIFKVLPFLELHQVLLYQSSNKIVFGLDYLPYNNKDIKVILRLLLGNSSKGCRRLRIFKNTSMEEVIVNKNNWILDDDNDIIYDMILQKDMIEQEIKLSLIDQNDIITMNKFLNNIEKEDSSRFDQLNFYNQNCIHYVDYLIKLQENC